MDDGFAVADFDFLHQGFDPFLPLRRQLRQFFPGLTLLVDDAGCGLRHIGQALGGGRIRVLAVL